jgi:hypothetical protein
MPVRVSRTKGKAMPNYTLSGPGGQETAIEAKNLDDAGEAAQRFAARYGILGEIDIYQEGEGFEPVMRWLNNADERPIYHFIYCASEQGSLARRCDDDTAARKHAHILADAHGESCHIARYTGQTTGEGALLCSIGRVEPRIPKS